MGATDNTIKQRNRAVEFCMGSYLADKHTHLEAPIRVKKPYMRIRSIVNRDERSEGGLVIGVKWMREKEGRRKDEWREGNGKVVKETTIV